jgi:hypothetical protein
MVLQMLKLIGQHTSIAVDFGKDFEKNHIVQKMV